DGIHVGDPADAPADAFAAIDPDTHQVVALDAGTGLAPLSINGVSTEVEITASALALTAVTPAIDGTARAGETLTAVTGAWKPEGVELSYQWAVDGVAVDGATAAT